MTDFVDIYEQDAKADKDKPKYTLVPPEIIRAVERVREYGTEKYKDPDNWRKVEADRYWEALIRHVLAAWWNYRAKDPESGLMHLDHICCNAAFLEQLISEGQNMPAVGPKQGE